MPDPIDISMAAELWSSGDNLFTLIVVSKGSQRIEFYAKDENAALTLMVELSNLINILTVDSLLE